MKSNPERTQIDPNPFLENRIARALDELEPLGFSPIPWKEISIGIAACVAVALVSQFVGNRERFEEPLVVELPVEAEPGAGLVSRQSDWRNPLDQEIENVMEDAKGAIDFLAQNFLPSSVLKGGEQG